MTEKMFYDLGGKGRIRDRILIEAPEHKDLIDGLISRINELNEFLKDAHVRGDCLDAVGGLSYGSDGPRFTLEIRKVSNGFWKEKATDSGNMIRMHLVDNFDHAVERAVEQLDAGVDHVAILAEHKPMEEWPQGIPTFPGAPTGQYLVGPNPQIRRR